MIVSGILSSAKNALTLSLAGPASCPGVSVSPPWDPLSKQAHGVGMSGSW